MYAPALGGAEHHLKAISEGLASRGHDVTVLTANARDIPELWSGYRGTLPAVEFKNGVKVIRFNSNGGLLGSAFHCWQRMRGGYRSQRYLFGSDGMEFLMRRPLLVQLVPYLAYTHADIVMTMNWFWPPAYFTYLARKLRRFKLVGIPLFHTAETWCDRAIYKHMLANSDAIIVNTPYEKNFVEKCAEVQVEVGGVGIEPKCFEHCDGHEIRERYRLRAFPVVGFVGRQVANKGVIKLLQAMETVWKWNSEVRLVLAGPKSHRHPEVDAKIAFLSNFERCRVVLIDDFPDSDKASLFDAFDVFALPSTAESFGIAYLEAWACRTPVIGSRIGPTECVIDHGIDGLLVDPADPEDIGRAIIDLLSDPSKRQKMGEKGRAKTLSHFTWDKVTDKVESLYFSLIRCSDPRKIRRVEPIL